MNKKRVALLTVLICTFPAVIYLPFRLVAQHINIATFGTVPLGASGPFDGNFVYPWAILIWPSFTLLVGFVTQIAVSILQLNRYFRFLAGILILVVSYCVPLLDSLWGIRGGGLNGFSEFTMRPSGLTTPFVSALACPLTFIAGGLCAHRMASRIAPIIWKGNT